MGTCAEGFGNGRSYTRRVAGNVTHKAIAGVASRIPGLRRLPVFKLLAIGEVALLARSHIRRLDPDERRRLVELLRKGRGRRTSRSAGTASATGSTGRSAAT